MTDKDIVLTDRQYEYFWIGAHTPSGETCWCQLGITDKLLALRDRLD